LRWIKAARRTGCILGRIDDSMERFMSTARRSIPGTTIFDGEQARKGYALNRMCYSFNDAANRVEFVRDEEAYCRRYGLNPAQRAAIARRNVLELIAAGGNIYYLAKFAGIFGLDVQDVGAQQTGMTKDAFKAKLVAAGER
jgi:protocatechuate 4,5-dioxygenase alpha chain